uniref:Uncharacterized protein n=1 Tax=Rhizophora mucronata TaxID=61149 RepID=A0A2P2QTU6_RHIMU
MPADPVINIDVLSICWSWWTLLFGLPFTFDCS